MDRINKAIIDSVSDYFNECPYIKNIATLNVDYLNVEGQKKYYSLEQLGEETILTNVLGYEKEREINFMLATRSFYDLQDKSKGNIENIRVLENIAEWVRDNNRERILPVLDDKYEATSISITSGPALYGISKSTETARYEIRGKLKYERKC